MRLLRGAVVLAGFGLLGVLGLVERILRRRDRGRSVHGHVHAGADVVAEESGLPVSRVLSRVRTVLGVLGVALAVYGVCLVVQTIPWTSYLAIAIWLAAAVILHDAVLVPAVSLLRLATLRVGRRLAPASVAVLEGAFVVGGVLSLIAVPEIYAKHLGPLNPSVLPGSYGPALLVTWLVLAVLAVGTVAALSARGHGPRGQRLVAR